MNIEVWPGVPYPLGATFTGEGVNFAVFSERATRIEVCLYDEAAPNVEVARFPLVDVTNSVWHGFVPQLRPGTLYGLRAHGPWAPEQGLVFHPDKLLVDPYAKAISGGFDWKGPLRLHERGDTAPFVPRAVVVHDDFDWEGEARPQVLWRKTVLYELNVKGFTQLHPAVPQALRGTYAGLAHPAVLEHLKGLGVTSVELLPVAERVSEGFLSERGLSNFWGYNTLGFFAPDQRFSSQGSRGGQVREFKQLVKALHGAGLEVILDVVFNHTCEGNEQGAVVSFRGLDNPTWYWLEPGKPSQTRDFTGCGNSLNLRHPQVVKFATEALRHWVSEFHVDGFRFDLSTTLGRVSDGGFDRAAPFFAAVHQDPVLSRVKLIAEPWDVGPGGYQVGNHPTLFAEWNDRYRDTVRRFWKGDGGLLSDLGYRLSGSSDLFKSSGRRPMASVNFVTAHDGFTLEDLVSYARKHNEANLEDNRDGTDNNHSFNCGTEGATADPLVLARRERQKRNLLATLLLSVGTPMLTAGDELARTQGGNNNAYCQDNGLSWVSWELDGPKQAFLAFCRKLLALRSGQRTLQRRNFFLGQSLEDSAFRDLVWFRPDGTEMTGADWSNPAVKTVGYLLGGDAIEARDPKGRKITADTLLIYLNSSEGAVEARLPRPGSAGATGWTLVLDTSDDLAPPRTLASGEALLLPALSVLVVRHGTSSI